ncbi:MAG: hypothetical protein GTO42_08900 [Candidatus Latescibacteria bacterium]|nr:hypothetical protein [Candidatus Latescibacterota bacterium]NIO29079.1 hypothetical protein [Candidatus Latescibacterota bacterium]NIO56704.1 hypothetical protein [Candidatus Latescibacterota bacterium]NIT02287.1 hypothetical protein [Candidatus Latescibacterota bacterium]NIT39172.1 hypothetical protein [Candidatus Latescibacterota bacterium]
MTKCFFVSDLHGDVDRYEKLFDLAMLERPKAIFLGGDILLSGISSTDSAHRDFVAKFLIEEFKILRKKLADEYPQIFMILGNDDGRFEEAAIQKASNRGLWNYIHDRRTNLGEYPIYGYSYVPPTPFHLKDWERYDVSRSVNPGCVPLEEGHRSIQLPDDDIMSATIKEDLEQIAGEDNLEKAVFLFHAPPHRTKLDYVASGGEMGEEHVGSIAIRNFIEARQPMMTLHGHVHESARLSGAWRDSIGRTICLSGAHDGPELALVRFHIEQPDQATRELV